MKLIYLCIALICHFTSAYLQKTHLINQQMDKQFIEIENKQAPRILQPRIETITINETYIYPQTLNVQGNGCFGKALLKIQQGHELAIKGNSPFVVYFNTKTTQRYSTIQEYYGKAEPKVSLNYLAESSIIERQHVVTIPLNMQCSSVSNAFLRMKGIIHIDFIEAKQQAKHEFSFILMCITEDQLKEFNKIYRPGYIFFCVYFNLALQIYHGYNRNNAHFALFMLYLLSSMLISEPIAGYLIALLLFIVVVLFQRKQQNINNKTFVIYNVFWLANCFLITFTYLTADMGYEWNSLQIVIENLIKLHITMFLILRLVKLPRLRYVFWYFVAVSLFAVAYTGNNSICFQIGFRNPLDLTCFKVDLFFPLMMLPIVNYFSSITGWMHRVTGFIVAIASCISLQAAIKLMGFTFVAILCYEIKAKNMSVIRHRY